MSQLPTSCTARYFCEKIIIQSHAVRNRSESFEILYFKWIILIISKLLRYNDR